MRWWIGALLLVLAGCASQPKAQQDATFNAYWGCVYRAATPYMTDARLAPRQAARRAQAACYPAYERYRNAKIAYVRSVVARQDYAMASQLARSSALERRRDVTRRITRLIAQARQ